VLGPRFDKKTLNEPTRFCGIPKQTPLKGAVTPAQPFHIPHGTAKFLSTIGINPIFDLNEDGTFVRLWLNYDNRLGPVRGRSQIQIAAIDKPIPQARAEAKD
jgi:hypothetical protein